MHTGNVFIISLAIMINFSCGQKFVDSDLPELVGRKNMLRRLDIRIPNVSPQKVLIGNLSMYDGNAMKTAKKNSLKTMMVQNDCRVLSIV